MPTPRELQRWMGLSGPTVFAKYLIHPGSSQEKTEAGPAAMGERSSGRAQGTFHANFHLRHFAGSTEAGKTSRGAFCDHCARMPTLFSEWDSGPEMRAYNLPVRRSAKVNIAFIAENATMR